MMKLCQFVFCVLFLQQIISASKINSRSLISSDEIWKEKLEKLKLLAEEYEQKEPENYEHSRSTGIVDFDVNFTCEPKPMTVHQLRPRDIDVIGAMGDSLTAANGAGGTTIIDVAREYRGVSWFSGGDNDVDTTLTIPNILRAFNPQVKGYSTGLRFDSKRDWWFNVAVPGARANDMPTQAIDLVEKMKGDERTNFENDWKLITIFIGGNDLCALDRSEDAQPENYVAFIREALDYLQKELPRTFINVVDILEIDLLPQVGQGYGSTTVCRIAQSLLCGYIVRANEEETEVIKRKNKEYQTLLAELIDSGRYDTTDDFTVVLQPFFRDTVLPLTKDGEVDSTFFAPDCFHFGAKAHAMGALNLWNNMLEPVGQKTTVWSISDLKCPTEESPYLFTSKNSGLEGSGSDLVTSPKTTTDNSMKTTSLPACDDVCPAPEPQDWLIAVICLLGAAVLCQAIILFILRSNKKKNSSKIETLK